MEEEIKYKLVRSNRRSVALIVTRERGIIVRAPYSMSADLIDRFVREKQDWIRKKLDNFKSENLVRKSKEFRDGEEFPYLGRMYKLKITGGVENVVDIKDELLFDSRYNNYIPQVLKVFYKLKAYEYLNERAKLLSEKTGLKYKSLKITVGKKRLGTCSVDNRLTFSYLLVMMPEEISDYIIYHELSHIKEKNHSPRFWEVVKKYVPDYRQKKKWLKENLHLYSFID